jgi:hypothetical protein
LKVGFGVAAACFSVVALRAEAVVAAGQIDSFSISPSSTQAGGRPDLSISFDLSAASETAAEVGLDAPVGIAVFPVSVPGCTAANFALNACSASSQVGLVTVYAAYGGEPQALMGTAPVYAIEAAAGELGRLAFAIPTIDATVTMPITVLSTDEYRLRFTAEALPEPFALAGADLTLWGVPADPAHNGERFPPGSAGAPPGCPGLADASCNTPTPSAAQAAAFLVNPTDCSNRSYSATLDLVNGL